MAFRNLIQARDSQFLRYWALCPHRQPRLSRPAARLRAVRELAGAGATRAGYVLLRLPHAVKDVFLAWLDTHAPTKKARILDRLASLRGGKLYDSAWGTRMRGEGIFADQLRTLFDVTARRAGLNREAFELTTDHFRRPGEQLSLF